MDTLYLVDLFVFKDACVHIKMAAVANNGKAFACGIARAMSGGAAVVATIGVFYMLWIVWSYCEDVESHGHINILGDLLGGPIKMGERLAHVPRGGLSEQGGSY